MKKVRHINCGTLHAPPNPKAACHCLLLEDEAGLALIDTGIGLRTSWSPVERVGREAIEAAGFLFNEAETAVRVIGGWGWTRRACGMSC